MELTKSKPASDRYLLSMQRLGVDTTECIANEERGGCRDERGRRLRCVADSHVGKRELVVRAKRAPGGYKAKRDDFRFSVRLNKDIQKDETREFVSDIEVPEGTGRWGVRFVFKANRKTVSTKNIRLQVEST